MSMNDHGNTRADSRRTAQGKHQAHNREKEYSMKLDVRAFSITCALIVGLGLFLVTWWIILFDGASGDPTFIGRVYRGYNISPLGSIFGLMWGLVDGFIGGLIFSWLYNMILGGNKPNEKG